MKTIAPHIYRQRLIIEGIYSINVSECFLMEFLSLLSKELSMSIIYGPIVKNLAGCINPLHKGFESLVIWVESGAQLYTWKDEMFFTLDIYSCKRFESSRVVELVRSYFKTTELEHKDV